MRIFNRDILKFRPDETTYYRPDSAQEGLQRRLAIMGLVIIAAFVLLLMRLWFMQIVGGKNYVKKAQENMTREISLEAPRGKMLDIGGRVIVKNRNVPTISVVRAEMHGNEDKVIARLSRLVGMSEKEIVEKIDKYQDPNQRAVLIKTNVPEETVVYVREHQREFPGVIAGTKPMRDYPYKSLAAHVIGYLGEISPEQLDKLKAKGYRAGDEIGLSGLENVYDEVLRGEVGRYVLKVNALGEAIEVLDKKDPLAGKNIKTSINMDIQAVVENALNWQIEGSRQRTDPETGKQYGSTGASAVVMNPKTGEIIAMASFPTFDLNDFVGGISVKRWKQLNDPKNQYPMNNRAIMSQLPPGSVFKVVTAVGGLCEGMAQPSSAYDCRGIFTKGPFKDFPMRCWSRHNRLDFINGITQSCDIVFYEIGYGFYTRQIQGVGKPLWEYAKDFRLGMKTNIDLTSEQAGRVPTPEWKKEFNKNNPAYQVWYPGDTVNMAIGQGDLLATPLQIACLYSAVANGGRFMKPQLVKEFVDEDGKAVTEVKPVEVGRLNLNPTALAHVSNALTGVVKGKGTAAATFEGFPLAQYPVAGKTGTSEIVGKQPTAWFVCYAPANDPQFVVAVAIEEGGHGGESAAPVARRILEGLFNIQGPGEIRPSVGD